MQADVSRLEERAESAEAYVEETRQALSTSRAKLEEVSTQAVADLDEQKQTYEAEAASTSNRHAAEVGLQPCRQE